MFLVSCYSCLLALNQSVPYSRLSFSRDIHIDRYNQTEINKHLGTGSTFFLLLLPDPLGDRLVLHVRTPSSSSSSSCRAASTDISDPLLPTGLQYLIWCGIVSLFNKICRLTVPDMVWYNLFDKVCLLTLSIWCGILSLFDKVCWLTVPDMVWYSIFV